MRRLEGRAAVVTGAGSGIGRAVALALGRAGCSLVVVDRDGARAEETAALLRAGAPARGPAVAATAHAVDVSDAAAVHALAATVAAAHGEVGVLVNNAGITTVGRFEAQRLEELHRVMDVNLWGVVHGCQAFLPLLRRGDEGHIVNLSSMVGLLGVPGQAAYVMSKAAVRGLSETLRVELAGAHIGVTSVHPGAVRTRMLEGLDTAGDSEARELIALAGRIAGSADVLARRIVTAIRRNSARVVFGADAHGLDLAARLAPGATTSLMGWALARRG